MSDWTIKDWRVAPRARYAFAFLIVAMVVSAVILGASIVAVPDVGGFDDDQVRLVAENRLSAVEALWVVPPDVIIYNLNDDGLPGPEPLDRFYDTDDITVRWVVASYFKLEAKWREVEKRSLDVNLEYDDLLETIDEKFGWVTVEGTHCAWELRFNGTRMHFGSDTVYSPDQIPDSHWTVFHEYSGEAQWWKGQGFVKYRAELRFHLWSEGESMV